jgi:hypothetical protein
MGVGEYSSTILYVGTRWRYVVSFTSRLHYTRGNRPGYPLGQEAGWASEPVWTLWRRELLTLPGLELNSSVVQPVASSYTDWAQLHGVSFDKCMLHVYLIVA